MNERFTERNRVQCLLWKKKKCLNIILFIYLNFHHTFQRRRLHRFCNASWVWSLSCSSLLLYVLLVLQEKKIKPVRVVRVGSSQGCQLLICRNHLKRFNTVASACCQSESVALARVGNFLYNIIGPGKKVLTQMLKKFKNMFNL